MKGVYFLKKWPCKACQKLVDVLWSQPMKLIQVASISELHKNQWNDLLFFETVVLMSYPKIINKLFPLIASGPQKYKYNIGHNYFTFQHPKKLDAFF